MSITCKTQSGSFNVTGILTLHKSFPIFLNNRLQRLKSPVSGFGAGSFERLPVLQVGVGGTSVTAKEKL